jgi:hypothetical protein
MRKLLSSTVLLTAILSGGAPLVWGQQAPRPGPARPQAGRPIISSRQIDRYDAINVVEQRLKENPQSLADWIILGELALEVALDLPADQATRYYRISRDAYEKALALRPDQPGLRAAVQFARDHEAHSQRFEEMRDRATLTYLEARRRDLAASRYTPSLPLYGPRQVPVATAPPTPPIAVPPASVRTPAPAVPPGSPASPAPAPSIGPPVRQEDAFAAIVAADPDAAITPPTAAQAHTANYGTRQVYSYSYPTYQAYFTQGEPYTYEQYSSGYYSSGVISRPTILPITVQRYLEILPPIPGRQPAPISP